MQLKIVANLWGWSYNNNRRGKLMSKKEKLIEKLLSKPKDFSYDEMETLLKYLGYNLKQGSGSGVKFIKEGTNEVINFHKPHPNGVLKSYILEQVIEKLRKDGLL
jgi:putative sterol carrier protein